MQKFCLSPHAAPLHNAEPAADFNSVKQFIIFILIIILIITITISLILLYYYYHYYIPALLYYCGIDAVFGSTIVILYT